MYIHIKKFEIQTRRPVSMQPITGGQTTITVGQVHYVIAMEFDIIDTQLKVQKLLDEAQLRLPKFLEGLVDDKGTWQTRKDMLDDERAEFILHQYSFVMELIAKEKLDIAVAYFKLTEQIYPEYQNNPRFNEINSLRNMTWDNLAKRGLI